MVDSIHHASSASVLPTNGCAASRSNISFVTAAARLIASSSSGSLTARMPSSSCAVGTVSILAASSAAQEACTRFSDSKAIRFGTSAGSFVNSPRGISTTSLPVARAFSR